MEIEDREEVWVEDVGETFEPEEESLKLPSEWLYGYSDSSGQLDQPLLNQESTESNANSSDIQQIDTVPGVEVQGKVGKVASSKPRKRGWGPVLPERKSKRAPLSGVNMLEKAQVLSKERTTWKLRKVKKFQNKFLLLC